MFYSSLKKELEKIKVNGWHIFHSVDDERGGLYLWPNNKTILRRQAGINDQRLKGCRILFEYHVTVNNESRLLARGWHRGNQKEWKQWDEWARKANADDVKDMGNKNTKSVAKWPIPQIKFDTDPPIAASDLKSFLENPPKSLGDFMSNF